MSEMREMLLLRRVYHCVMLLPLLLLLRIMAVAALSMTTFDDCDGGCCRWEWLLPKLLQIDRRGCDGDEAALEPPSSIPPISTPAPPPALLRGESKRGWERILDRRIDTDNGSSKGRDKDRCRDTDRDDD